MKYDLYIFDLDDTILLHSARKDYREEYEKRLITFLNKLNDSGKTLALVTYNSSPKTQLEKLGIYHLFSYIYSPYITTFENYTTLPVDINSTVWMRPEGVVTICKKKHIIVKDILHSLSIPNHKAIFFDDHRIHVNSVEKIGVKSILSDPLLGIPFKYFS